jgi:threonine synthase
MIESEYYRCNLIRHPRFPAVLVAAEYLLPAGSFKDRGARRVVADAKAKGADLIATDSSGNAGFAIALYAARSKIRARIHVVETAAPEKIALIRATGADIIVHPNRAAATSAAANEDAYDGSHIRNPIFWAGVAEMNERWAAEGPYPDEVWLPVGNGSLLFGLALGFGTRLPRLVGIQPARCAPIANPGEPLEPTLADGVSVGQPMHETQLRAIVQRSSGRWESISEQAIEAAFRNAWADGFPIEPTSALPFALLEEKGNPSSPVVIVATGSGLKHPPAVH